MPETTRYARASRSSVGSRAGCRARRRTRSASPRRVSPSGASAPHSASALRPAPASPRARVARSVDGLVRWPRVAPCRRARRVAVLAPLVRPSSSSLRPRRSTGRARAPRAPLASAASARPRRRDRHSTLLRGAGRRRRAPSSARRTAHGPRRSASPPSLGRTRPRGARRLAASRSSGAGRRAGHGVAGRATLYVATLDGSLVALARDDGTRRWSVALGDRVYSTPLVQDDGTIYVGTDAKKLVALSPKGEVALSARGRRRGRHGRRRSARTARSSSRPASTSTPSRRGGDLAWRFAAKGKVFTAPAVTDDGLVIVGSQDTTSTRSDPAARSRGRSISAPTSTAPRRSRDDGAIYVGTDKGEVVRLDARRARSRGARRSAALSAASSRSRETATSSPGRTVRFRASFGVAPDGVDPRRVRDPGHGRARVRDPRRPARGRGRALFFGAQDDAVYAIGA